MKRLLLLFIILLISISMLVGCTESTTSPTDEETSSEENFEGTYEGSAEGYHGELKVEVTLDEAGKILNIEVDENHGETEDIGTLPIEQFPEQIISSQSLEIDTITGATITGDALIAAIAGALESAGLDLAAYDYAGISESTENIFELDTDSLPEKVDKTGSITLTDAKGREVTIDQPISRYAVSTMDVVDFIIPILGEDSFHKLVGSGQDGGGGLQGYSKLYTPVVGEYMRHVGQISDHNAPFDLEMILATDPDVLIVNSAMGAHNYAMEIEPQLTEVGIPIVLIDVPGKSFTNATQETSKILGEIFQEEERASELIAFIDEQFDIVESKNLSKRSDRPTVYYEKSGYSEIFGSTSTSASGWGTVIDVAGGDNIADPILLESAASKGGNNTLDPEYIIQSDPDFIILSGSGTGWMDNHKDSTPSTPQFDIINRTGWDQLSAVKNNNVYEIAHATSRSIFGFHGTLKLASIFYPEEFNDIDPDEILDEFFQRFMLVNSDVTGWVYQVPGVLY